MFDEIEIVPTALAASMQKNEPPIKPLLLIPVVRFLSRVLTCGPVNSSLPPTLMRNVAGAWTEIFAGVHFGMSPA